MKGTVVLPTFQILGILVFGRSYSGDLVGALQSPLDTGASFGGQKWSSNNRMKKPDHQQRYYSSLKPVSPSAIVVKANALVHGPAYAAALERASMETTSSSTTRNIEDNENRRSNHPLSPANETNKSSSSRKAALDTQSLAISYSNLSSTSNTSNEPSEASPPPVPAQSPPKAPTTTNNRTETPVGSNSKGPVAIAESIEDLLALMDGSSSSDDDNNSGSDNAALTLVLFHAKYCKICQRATMQLTRVAKEYPSVQFAKVEAKAFPEPSAENLRSLGVTKFPFVQIYRSNGDCVASFSTGPTHMFMRKIRDTLDVCLERDEICWNDFDREFSGEIQANRDARKVIGTSKLLP
mmetsp:Transcript_10601/g.25521  ORF Transcript_10601/g.25521 Transcript_10601/m.25521 type:complete len:352 (-) Transcript_10601:196-1251(-)